jgi:hypothetical protein
LRTFRFKLLQISFRTSSSGIALRRLFVTINEVTALQAESGGGLQHAGIMGVDLLEAVFTRAAQMQGIRGM